MFVEKYEVVCVLNFIIASCCCIHECCVVGVVHMCHGVHVEFRVQLCRVGFASPTLCRIPDLTEVVRLLWQVLHSQAPLLCLE